LAVPGHGRKTDVFAAVVVTFRAAPGRLAEAVASVLADPLVERLVVVDNGDAATASLGPLLAQFDGRLVVIRSGSNLGFGDGANLGIRRCLGEGATWIAVLNDDLHVEPDWSAPLLEALDADPGLGAVQPKLLFAHAATRTVNSVGVTLDAHGAGHDLGLGEPDGPEFSEPMDIPIFTGGAVLFTRSFLESTGGFAPRWFLYYEDVDLALRGAAAGWRYRCIPASVVWHDGSASTAQLGDRTRYLQERNRLWLLARHGTPAMMRHGVWLSVRRLRYRPRRTHLKALVVGLAGWPAEFVRRARRMA